MRVVERINILIWTWIQSLRSAKKISIFLPFFLFTLLQSVILTALILFFVPPFSQVLVPLMERLYGEPALHYPHNFVVLPTLFFGANRWLSLLVSWLVIGTATLMFAAKYRSETVQARRSFYQALRCMLPLFVLGAVEWSLVFLMTRLFRFMAPEILMWGAHSHRLLRLAGFLCNVVIMTPFAFTTPQVVLGKRNIWTALTGSFSLAKSNFGVTFLIIAIPAFFSWIVDVAAGRAPLMVAKFSPEIVVFLLGLGVVVTLLVNFVIVGALTALYLGVAEGTP
ncbi:MAG: hypothetical protein AMJ92_03325 [candidate division Zixibacteria bacterium SM23_81]|nr:MAG: hypothetical protein AMJ92_03325 [candidate division Zixibacteria bacterium SM23_81]